MDTTIPLGLTLELVCQLLGEKDLQIYQRNVRIQQLEQQVAALAAELNAAHGHADSHPHAAD